MKILIDKNDDELYLFKECKIKKYDSSLTTWRLDTVYNVDEISRFFGKIYELLIDKEE